MKPFLFLLILTGFIFYGCSKTEKQVTTSEKTETKSETSTIAPERKNLLINNVQIFNGKDEKTITGNVLIIGDLINKISESPIAIPENMKVEIIDGKGKFLMPGLIDNHVHLAMSTLPMTVLRDTSLTIEKVNEYTIAEGKNVLMRGFTTVRDMGGPVFTAKKEFDKGINPGPRVFPSGGMISQTSGHGDFRMPDEKSRRWGGNVSKGELYGFGFIADGIPEVLTAVRENLREGATQIKMMAGGGSSTIYDPLDVAQYTFEELKAGVDAADDWGTYVTVHAYTPKAVKKSIDAGVKCIEHGNLLDEETIKLAADKGVWLCTMILDKPTPDMPESYREKRGIVVDGTDNMMNLVKRYKVKLALGTDHLFEPEKTKKQTQDILKLKQWFTPFEILKLVTYDNAQLLYLSGNRNPYQKGKLGEISEGAYADLLLVDGNPLADIDVLSDYEKNFVLIVKDGIIYKNSLR